jgi:hypothetical protein
VEKIIMKHECKRGPVRRVNGRGTGERKGYLREKRIKV